MDTRHIQVRLHISPLNLYVQCTQARTIETFLTQGMSIGPTFLLPLTPGGPFWLHFEQSRVLPQSRCREPSQAYKLKLLTNCCVKLTFHISIKFKLCWETLCWYWIRFEKNGDKTEPTVLFILDGRPRFGVVGIATIFLRFPKPSFQNRFPASTTSIHFQYQ